MKAQSSKKRAENRERAAMKAALLVEAGLVRIPEPWQHDAIVRGCGGRRFVPEIRCASPFLARPTLEMHEIVKRARWRKGATERANVVLLCQAHHDWTETEVREATKRGLLSSAPRVDPFDKFDAFDPEGER